MAPTLRHRVVFACILAIIIRYSSAGPLLRLKRQVPVDVEDAMPLESLCIVGDMKYALGAAIPGGSCDQCVCGSNSSVECTRVACDPAPGCKALHRPDHCCPLYQCECEVDGRIFANGEKRIDPADPCSVCYCQGGDFACSRLACFRRDDCEARFHPGRCCPEYDHCPIRDASTEPNQRSNTSFGDQKPIEVDVPEIVDQDIKKEITIKEITPVSEIPSVSGIRIKEILKPNNLEVNDYNYDGTKSPLIPREVVYNPTTAEPSTTMGSLKTSELTSIGPTSTVEVESTDKVLYIKLGNLGYENKGASTPATVIKVIGAEGLQRGEEDENIENNLEFAHNTEPKVNYEQLESKTDNTTNVENVTLILTEVVNELYKTTTTETSDSLTTSTPNPNVIHSNDKSSIAQQYTEEDLPPVDHNPEFPPIPDDIMVLNVPDDNTDLSPETLHLEVDHGSHSNAENIVLVKRPVFSLPSYQDKTEGNKVNNEENKTKILQETLPLIKINVSNSNDVTTIIPDDQLKSTASDVKISPFLNLETATSQDISNLPAETINDDEIKISNISYAIEFDKDAITTEEPTTTIGINELDTSTSERNEFEKNPISRKIDVLPIHTTDLSVSPESSMQMTNSDLTDSTSTISSFPSTSTHEVTEKTHTNFSPDNTGTTLKGSTALYDSTVGTAEIDYGIETNGPSSGVSRLVIKEVLPSSTPGPSYTANGFSVSSSDSTLTTQGYSTVSPNADESSQLLLARSTETPLKVYEVTEKIFTDPNISTMPKQSDSLSTSGFSIKEVGTKTQLTITDVNAPSTEAVTTMIMSENVTKIKSSEPVSSELADKSSTVGNGKSNNILADLISLVEDVATIGSQKSTKTNPDSLKSEELMLTSLNGTNNDIDSGFTLDPITDTDSDIDDEESTSITDRREQTTKKPIIDDVTDVNLQQSTTEGLKDVEFVPKVNVSTLETIPKKLVTEETFVSERKMDTSPTTSPIDHSTEIKLPSTESTPLIETSISDRTETTSEIVSTTISK